MKVLWFTNTPSLADERLNLTITGGGWIKSLEREIKREDIDLGITFYVNDRVDPFLLEGVAYFPVYNKKSFVSKIVNRFRVKLEAESDLATLLKIVEEFKPDIIHIHGTENPFGKIIGKVSVPVVISLQGILTVYHHKYYSGIERTKFCFWSVSYYYHAFLFMMKNLLVFLKKGNKEKLLLSAREIIRVNSPALSYHRFGLMKIREQEVLKNCKNIIGRTAWDRRVSRILAPKSKYYHNNEILRSAFYTSKWDKARSESFVIHVTTSNSLYKGFETLIAAISFLSQRDIDFECNIAGLCAHDTIVQTVRQKLGKSFKCNNINFIGRVNENQLISSMLKADLFVLPSHIENSPNSLCEAMLLGMPCISTHSGGSSTLLKDGIEGILIQSGDPWSMSGAILELYSDPQKAIRFGKSARMRAKERHNPKSITGELLNIYKKCCASEKTDNT